MSEKRDVSRMLEGSDLMGFAGPKGDRSAIQGSARTSTAKFDKAKNELSKSPTRSRG